MTVFNDTWRFLVQRKLWPVAILLVAAAVAVPMLLAKEPAAPAAPAVAAVKAEKSTLATEPIVALASDGDRAGRRRVLGSREGPLQAQRDPDPDPDARVRRRRPPLTRTEPGRGARATGGSRPARPARRRAPASPRRSRPSRPRRSTSSSS